MACGCVLWPMSRVSPVMLFVTTDPKLAGHHLSQCPQHAWVWSGYIVGDQVLSINRYRLSTATTSTITRSLIMFKTRKRRTRHSNDRNNNVSLQTVRVLLRDLPCLYKMDRGRYYLQCGSQHPPCTVLYNIHQHIRNMDMNVIYGRKCCTTLINVQLHKVQSDGCSDCTNMHNAILHHYLPLLKKMAFATTSCTILWLCIYDTYKMLQIIENKVIWILLSSFWCRFRFFWRLTCPQELYAVVRQRRRGTWFASVTRCRISSPPYARCICHSSSIWMGPVWKSCSTTTKWKSRKKLLHHFLKRKVSSKIKVLEIKFLINLNKWVPDHLLNQNLDASTCKIAL